MLATAREQSRAFFTEGLIMNLPTKLAITGKCRDFSRRTLLARQLTKSTVLSAQISTFDASAD